MTNFKALPVLLLCISTIFAEETAPKTLPELIEYARKNLSDFSIPSFRDHYIIHRHIAHDLEWLSRSDNKEIHFDIKRAKDTIEETQARLIEYRNALCQEQSAARQEMLSEDFCSYRDFSASEKLFEHIVWGKPVKENVTPNKKCLNSIIKAMQATVHIATITKDLEVCNAIGTALDQLKR